jgi:hypothetical protein
MNHSVDGVLLQQRCQSSAVGQIGDFKMCANRHIGLARIGRHQCVAIGRETAQERRADQASGAGDKDVAQSLPAPG